MLIHILGEMLKEARIKNNLTLEELSGLTDISIAELCNLEQGNIKMPCSVFLYRLSNVLKIDYNEMLKYKYASYYRKRKMHIA